MSNFQFECPVCGRELTPDKIDDMICTYCGANLNNYTTMRKHPYEDDVRITYSPEQKFNTRRPKSSSKKKVKHYPKKRKPPKVAQSQTKTKVVSVASSTSGGMKSKKKENIANTEYGIRLFGFMRLFRDVFGKFSPQQVVDLVSIASDYSDERKLLLLRSFEREFISSLAEVMPNDNPELLSLWYGLDGNMPRSLHKMTKTLKIPSSQLRQDHQRIIVFLKSPDGGKIIKNVAKSI